MELIFEEFLKDCSKNVREDFRKKYSDPFGIKEESDIAILDFFLDSINNNSAILINKKINPNDFKKNLEQTFLAASHSISHNKILSQYAKNRWNPIIQLIASSYKTYFNHNEQSYGKEFNKKKPRSFTFRELLEFAHEYPNCEEFINNGSSRTKIYSLFYNPTNFYKKSLGEQYRTIQNLCGKRFYTELEHVIELMKKQNKINNINHIFLRYISLYWEYMKRAQYERGLNSTSLRINHCIELTIEMVDRDENIENGIMKGKDLDEFKRIIIEYIKNINIFMKSKNIEL